MIKKLSLILAFLVLQATAFAQNYGGGVDYEKLHFGFSFQYISAEYKILKNPNWRAPFSDPVDGPVTPTVNAISSPPAVGFGLGFVVDRMINKTVNLRITPGLIFSDRLVRYEYDPQAPVVNPNGSVTQFESIVDKKIQATMFEIPIGIKVKSDRMNNFRVYWIGGGKFSTDIASKKKTFDDGEAPINKFLKNKRNYFSYETAIGFDIYFEYFKMSPELKLSYSVADLLQHSNTAFATPIDKMKLRQFTFSLFFE